MSAPEGICKHCNAKVTLIRRPGISCTGCKKVYHRACTNIANGHQIWTCQDCKNKRKSNRASLSHNARQSLSRNSVNTAVSENSSIDSMTKEITELKSTNARILEILSTLNEKFTLMSEFRDENMVLRASNQRLVKENSDLTRAMRLHTDYETNINASLAQPADVIDNRDSNSGQQMGARSSRSTIFPTVSTNSDDQAAVVSSVSQMETLSLPPSSSSTQTFNRVAIRAAEPQKWIFVSNLQPTTTCEDIKAHIVANVNVQHSLLTCSRITPKSIVTPFYATFKVGVPSQLFKEIVDPVLWPGNVKLREFLQRGGGNFRLRDQERETN